MLSCYISIQSFIPLLFAQCLLPVVLGIQVQLQAVNGSVPSFEARIDDGMTTVHFPAPQDPAQHEPPTGVHDTTDLDEGDWLDLLLADSMFGFTKGEDAELFGGMWNWLEESAAREHAFFETAGSQFPTSYNSSVAASEGVLTTHGPNLTDIATMMEAENSTCFGFVVLKTWGYGDAEQGLWDNFWENWTAYFDQHMSELEPRSDASGRAVASLLRWHLVEDPALDDASLDILRERFRAELCDEDKGVESGIDGSIALVPGPEFAGLDVGTLQTASVLGLDAYTPIKFMVEERKYHEAEHKKRFGIPVDDLSYTTIMFEGYLGIALGAIPDAWHALGIGETPELWRCSGIEQVYRGSMACQEEEGMSFYTTVIKGPGPEDENSYH